METKHTPGPWVLEGEIKYIGDTEHYIASVRPVSDIIYRGHVCYIQSCDHIKSAIDKKEAEANAKLIAAAPELLEALKKLTEQIVMDCSLGSDPKMLEMLKVHQKAMLALQKATE